ncbi:hypothetical protein [Brachyspira pilosicoli]|uniref:Uncharacterized protein n=1 Tax=Brachyspira pilosicoli TaxID=52584 RepID=A0A5C8EFE0_BRAPL|nr:hypothetical protein [Brachyspira pilosicoli]TXJ36423.1 hypothetical protein EPJ72_12045 [Brachyspira pilosicoli]
MKNKNIFLKIYIVFVVILTISVIVLSILGKKERTGYLSEFNINVNKTLEINGLDKEETKQLFTIDNKLDNTAVANYIFTNTSITNYSYNFRIKYYSKIFRNSDIYDVYPRLNNLTNYVKSAKMNDRFGTPFGNLISSKELSSLENIDNVNYYLKVKYKIYIYILTIMLILLITVFIKKIIIFFKKINKIKIIQIYSAILILYIVFIFVLYFYSNDKHTAVISNFELLYETSEGFVYKSNIYPNKIFLNDKFYRYSNEPLILNNIPTEIKNYGYAIEIDTSKDIYIYNRELLSYPKYNLHTSKGEIYELELLAEKILNTNDENIYYFLDPINLESVIRKSSVNTNQNFILYKGSNQIEKTFDDDKYNNTISFKIPDGSNIKYIKIKEISQNLYIKNNEYCIFTSFEKLPIGYKIDNVEYKLKISNNIYVLLFIFIIIYLILLYYCNKNILYKYITDKIFICIIIIVGLFISIFQFYLGFPGNYSGDPVFIILESLTGYYQNLNPIFISVFLKFLYNIFGYHTFYMFFINIFSFGIAVMLLIIALYIRYRNKCFIFLYLINSSIILNIFTTNFIPHKDFVMARLVFLLYSLVFFQIIVNIKNIYAKILLKIFTVIIFIFALLWRHNSIVTLYPIFILYAYIIISKLKEIKLLKKIIYFIAIMFVSAIVLITIVKINPYIYKNNGQVDKYASNHIFLIQISACAVMADDPSMIPNEYYVEGKNFEDVKELYNKNQLNADYFGSWNYKEITPYKYFVHLNGLAGTWIKYIIKYPFFYLKHIINFTYHIWLKTYGGHIEDKYIIQEYPLHYYIELEKYYSVFPKNELSINFSDFQLDIFTIISKYSIRIYYSIPIIISILIFISSTLFIFIYKSKINNILIFSFSTSFSAFATAIIVAIFSPVVSVRYIFPVLTISIISAISFIMFIYEYIINKNNRSKK